ncbi:MAG TPA: hypothetical protein VG817_09620 [Gemmatimonadales bacterium]|nr:hypothetical protein [Gemmatimonadales bacterium]
MRRLPILVSLVLGLGCADATEPLPPPVELLLVVHRTDATLVLLPADASGPGNSIPLGGAGASPTTVAAFNGIALVPLGAEPAVAVVDLEAQSVVRTIQLPANSGATGVAIVDDSLAYVANPNRNSVTRVNYRNGDTASVAVGLTPQAVLFTRGKIYVSNANLDNGSPLSPGWVSVVDPVTNRLATGVDSIPLSPPGNPGSGAVAQDGLIYLMNAGPETGIGDGRLSIVDPVGREELASFKGFGHFPGQVATNGVDRLYISSLSQGLMVFDLLKRQVLRGAGNGVAVPTNTGVAVDREGRIYALEGGGCDGSDAGQVHIYRRNLTLIRSIAVDDCPVAALITEVPGT